MAKHQSKLHREVWTHSCVTCSGWLCPGRGLDWMMSRGPLQPQPFWDSVILFQQSLRRNVEFGKAQSATSSPFLHQSRMVIHNRADMVLPICSHHRAQVRRSYQYSELKRKCLDWRKAKILWNKEILSLPFPWRKVKHFSPVPCHHLVMLHVKPNWHKYNPNFLFSNYMSKM